MKMVLLTPRYIERMLSDPKLDDEQNLIEEIDSKDTQQQRLDRLIAAAETIPSSALVYHRSEEERAADAAIRKIKKAKARMRAARAKSNLMRTLFVMPTQKVFSGESEPLRRTDRIPRSRKDLGISGARRKAHSETGKDRYSYRKPFLRNV